MKEVSLFRNPLAGIPPEDRGAFLAEIRHTNFVRARSVAVFMLVVDALLVYVIDIRKVVALVPDVARLSLLLHALLAAAPLGLLFLCRDVRSREDITPAHRAVVFAFRIFSVLFLAAIFLLTYLRNGNVSVHHIGVFAIAMMFFLPAWWGLLVYAADVVLYFLALGLRPGVDADYYLSGFVAAWVAWFFGRLILDARVRDFLAARVIARQAADLERANRELVLRHDELARLNAEKNEFLGIAAHDMKNPLNIVVGYAETLLEEPEMTAEERSDFVKKILQASRRMIELIRGLLDVNAIERGEIRLAPVPTDLATVARHVAESYQAAARTKGQLLHVEAESVVISADPNVLLQVTDNLVSNAVKYSPPGKSIFVRTRAPGRTAVFEVEDQGPGFTAEDRAKLFGSFSRLSARPTGGEHSTGLGLSIVKRLIEAMGGRIRCESEPGQGARFVAEWPLP